LHRLKVPRMIAAAWILHVARRRRLLRSVADGDVSLLTSGVALALLQGPHDRLFDGQTGAQRGRL
jgi:hypothetical protein